LVEATVAVVEDEVVVIEQPTPEPAPIAAVVETPEDTSASTASTASVTPGSYVYFFTGVPVQPAPMPIAPTTYFAYSGFTFTSVSVVSAPVVQPYYVAPVFVPQMVPSRMATPRWVYSQGAFFNSQVYFPYQPVYNAVYVIAP